MVIVCWSHVDGPSTQNASLASRVYWPVRQTVMGSVAGPASAAQRLSGRRELLFRAGSGCEGEPRPRRDLCVAQARAADRFNTTCFASATHLEAAFVRTEMAWA